MGIFPVGSSMATPPVPVLDNKRTRQLLRLLERRQPLSVVVAGMLIVALMSLNWLGAGVLLRAFQLAAALRGFDIGSTLFQAASAVSAVVFMLPAPMVCMIVRDWWFRRMVRRRAMNMDCVFCSYPLSSLDTVKASVCCPECGADHRAMGRVMLPAAVLEG